MGSAPDPVGAAPLSGGGLGEWAPSGVEGGVPAGVWGLRPQQHSCGEAAPGFGRSPNRRGAPPPLLATALKADFELSEGVEFSTSKSRPGGKLYLCHRTGKFKSSAGRSPRGRAPRETPTIKVGFDCTAFISQKTDKNGRVLVDACLEHYGHDINPKYLHFSAKTQSTVAKMLSEDRDPAYIVEMHRQRGEGRERLIRAQDVRNIQKKCGLGGSFRSNNRSRNRSDVAEIDTTLSFRDTRQDFPMTDNMETEFYDGPTEEIDVLNDTWEVDNLEEVGADLADITDAVRNGLVKDKKIGHWWSRKSRS